MIIFLILVAGYCCKKHFETRNWLEEQKSFYLTRSFYWTHYPDEFDSDRIHFSTNGVKTRILTPDEVQELLNH